MTTKSKTQDRSDRLNEVLLAYVEACEAGDQPNRDEILSQHPDLQDDLALFFSERDRWERLTGPVRKQEHLGSREPDDQVEIFVTPPVNGQLGDFRLVREVGRGGMGTVYEAEQISLNRRVALKVLPFASALDPRQLQRFRNEASAAAHLRHEHIVAVYAVGCERGVHYFAMQFVEGQSLAALLAGQRSKTASKSLESTVALAAVATEPQVQPDAHYDWVAGLGRQAALALEHAHQTGVVHRDVKPGNLLLDAHGHLWVADFGLAQVSSDVALTMTGEMLGTLRYASPEQMRGRRGVVDHRSDIYSLGATLYELLTLRPPLDGLDRHELLRQVADEEPPSLRSLVPEIPESLETIVLKTLRKEPADRYASAQELADDLQRFLDRRPILARPPRLVERFWAWTRRHPASLLASVTMLVCVTLGSVLMAVLVGAERERTQAAQRRAENAFHAEQSRAVEAESRLQLARRAVDELLLISEEELADQPEMLLLRKRVLHSALTFYQEFLAERRADAQADIKLRETTERVERILADLEALRSTTHFYLLRQSAVLDDLAVTEQQRPRLHELTERVGQEWVASFRDIGLTSPAERARRTLDRARANEASLRELLSTRQQQRLRQIGLQSEGAAAFRDQEVAAAIQLTAEQREQIRAIEEEVAYGWLRGPRPSRAPAGEETTADASPQSLSSDQRIVKILTTEQVRRWRELTGEPLQGMTLPASPLQKNPSVQPLK